MKDKSKLEILGILEDFDFCSNDFIVDGGLSVVSEAVSKCESQMPAVNVDEINYIAGTIEKKFLRKLSDKTIWLSDLSSGRIICEIDGVRVTGKINFKPKAITVTIGEEEEKLTRSSCLFSDAATIYTEEPFDGSPANNYGLSRAQDIILGLFANSMQVVKLAQHR